MTTIKTCFKFILLSLALIHFVSCANIVPPSGGDADHTAPKLLSMSPADSMLGQKVKKIVLHFDKFMVIKDLGKNMTMSPLLEYPPTVTAIGKRVEIKIVDSLLQANTTYKIKLGKAMTDNRESTPYEDFSYTFSTGSYFDSLQLKGTVIDALTGMPDTACFVQLYPEYFNDSTLSYKKPLYVAKVDGSGYFQFTSLPDQHFKIKAIADADGNNVWNRDMERIGFISKPLQPWQANDSSAKNIEIRTSLMANAPTKKDSLSTDSLLMVANKYVGRHSNKSKNAAEYAVNVDTFTKDKGSFELDKKLEIKLNAVLQKLDTARVFLSYLNTGGIESQASINIGHDTNTLFIQHNWIPETQYTLRLVKGWAVDTAKNELKPAKYIFKTKSLQDYASLRVHIPDTLANTNNVLIITQNKDTIYNKAIQDSLINLSMLKPGKCDMLIIKDLNENGKWDAGNIFTGFQPEYIIHHEGGILLKAGWDHEVDFEPRSSKNVPSSTANGKPGMR